jgi:hypothetical protein
MARIDSHQGRATADFETSRLYSGMEGWQKSFGDTVAYYRFDFARTAWDDLYDEVTGAGRVYQSPIQLNCQHVTLFPGPQEWDNAGAYKSAALRAIVSYEVYTQSGMVTPDIHMQRYDFDRLVYKDHVYRITQVNDEGQLQERPTVVSIDALQLRNDELVEDVQFADYANRPIL